MRDAQQGPVYRKFVRAQQMFSVGSKEQLQSSRELFRQVTQEAPDFARAWGWLSYSYVQGVIYDYDPPEVLELAEDYAQKAVDLNGKDFANVWDLAFAKLYFGQVDSSVDLYRYAFQLTRDDTDKLDRSWDVKVEGGEALVYQGNPQEAIAVMEQARQVPAWYRWNMAFACYVMGRTASDPPPEYYYRRAIQELNWAEVRRRPRDYVYHMHLVKAAAHFRLDQAGKARAEIGDFEEKSGAPITSPGPSRRSVTRCPSRIRRTRSTGSRLWRAPGSRSPGRPNDRLRLGARSTCIGEEVIAMSDQNQSAASLAANKDAETASRTHFAREGLIEQVGNKVYGNWSDDQTQACSSEETGYILENKIESEEPIGQCEDSAADEDYVVWQVQHRSEVFPDDR